MRLPLSADHPVDHNVGGNSDDDTCKFLGFECGEANLDIQYITAVAQQVAHPSKTLTAQGLAWLSMA
jgi:hypothetical protein